MVSPLCQLHTEQFGQGGDIQPGADDAKTANDRRCALANIGFTGNIVKVDPVASVSSSHDTLGTKDRTVLMLVSQGREFVSHSSTVKGRGRLGTAAYEDLIGMMMMMMMIAVAMLMLMVMTMALLTVLMVMMVVLMLMIMVVTMAFLAVFVVMVLSDDFPYFIVEAPCAEEFGAGFAVIGLEDGGFQFIHRYIFTGFRVIFHDFIFFRGPIAEHVFTDIVQMCSEDEVRIFDSVIFEDAFHQDPA